MPHNVNDRKLLGTERSMDESKKRRPNFLKASNFISRLAYMHTFHLFWKGLKRTLQEDDIVETVEDHFTQKLGSRLEKYWLKETFGSQPSLIRVILKTFYTDIIIMGFATVFVEMIRVSQPVALYYLVKYYTQTEGVLPTDFSYVCAGWLIAASLIYSQILSWQMLNLALLGMKIRVACTSLIYKKSLTLRISTAEGVSIGQITNLLSNDTGKLDLCMLHLHTLWICPLEVVAVLVLLYSLGGFTSMMGLFLMVMLIPVQVYCGKMASQNRLKTAQKSDERIRFTNEIISGIHTIKMITLEKPLARVIGIVRGLELRAIKDNTSINVFFSSIIFCPKIAIFLSVLIYTLTGEPPTVEYLFTITPFYNILRDVVTVQFVKGVAEVADARGSLNRIQNFLSVNESRSSLTNSYVTKPKQKGTVLVENLTAKWNANGDDVLHDVSLYGNSNELVAVIGSVGSGKTAILYAILNELLITSGQVHIGGRISYAAQEPWIFSGTVQQNILLGKKLSLNRYKEVIKVCGLEHDLEQLMYGDKTEVGERGVKLSGGQRARINLARAVYQEADVYLLDDPLSAIDASVRKHIFRECITKFLGNKCRILVTHQLQYLQNVDNIYLINDGSVSVSGSYQTISETDSVFANYLKSEEIVTVLDEPKKDPEKLLLEKVEFVENEARRNGGISLKTYSSYFDTNKSYTKFVLILVLFTSTQVCASGLDCFGSYWVNMEHNQEFGFLQTTTNCLYVYCGICAAFVVVLFVRSSIFYRSCLQSSTVLHQNMFGAVINSPVQFFNEHSSGQILNRFSKDLGIIDEYVPKSAMLCLQIVLLITGTMIVVSVIAPWMLLTTAFIMVVLYFLRRIYVPTGINVKRLEGSARSPILAQVNATLQGLTTIRALKAESMLVHKFYKLQDLHSSTFALCIICARAFSYYVELSCVVYIAAVVSSIVYSQSDYQGGTIGLAITQVISISGLLQFWRREWTELDSYMTSVERVIEYTKLKPEQPIEIPNVADNWPDLGAIKFNGVSLKYPSSNSPAINDISFHINPRNKIGVVGRTGAGKSSLIVALFQLTPTEGTILIDDVDIQKVSFEKLRSSISIIPQQPFLFSGTLRSNLDPSNQFTDDELWNILEEVQLKRVIADNPLGLECLVNEGGLNFSVGQKQLICLARTLASKNKILVLDEATSNIDPHSDAIIQETIGKRFGECTVITIAHRLQTVISCDKIIVMDNGKLVECDSPHALLNNETGVFYTMVQKLGKEISEDLISSVKSCDYSLPRAPQGINLENRT